MSPQGRFRDFSPAYRVPLDDWILFFHFPFFWFYHLPFILLFMLTTHYYCGKLNKLSHALRQSFTSPLLSFPLQTFPITQYATRADFASYRVPSAARENQRLQRFNSLRRGQPPQPGLVRSAEAGGVRGAAAAAASGAMTKSRSIANLYGKSLVQRVDRCLRCIFLSSTVRYSWILFVCFIPSIVMVFIDLSVFPWVAVPEYREVVESADIFACNVGHTTISFFR